MYFTKTHIGKMAITQNQFKTLNDLFDYYNKTLFGGTLDECLVNMSRHRGAHGFFAWDRWKERNTEKLSHEISLNPDTMNRADRLWHSTLVHEMCHLWQQTQGDKVRKAYHNKQFAAKMKEVGLQCSTTGAPGGKETGQSMTHYIIEGGPFEKAFNAIESEDLEALRIPYVPAAPKLAEYKPVPRPEGGTDSEDDEGEDESEPEQKSKSGVKIKYSCGEGCNVWGKPGLKLNCGAHETKFEEA